MGDGRFGTELLRGFISSHPTKRTLKACNLVYNYAYGPNYFDWTGLKKPFMMKGVSCNLYLVSIDIGAIAGTEELLVWKIGITKKEVIGEHKTRCRFSGEVANHVSVLRLRQYKDARDAFMVEQTILKMNESDYFRSRKKLDGSNKVD